MVAARQGQSGLANYGERGVTVSLVCFLVRLRYRAVGCSSHRGMDQVHFCPRVQSDTEGVDATIHRQVWGGVRLHTACCITWIGTYVRVLGRVERRRLEVFLLTVLLVVCNGDQSSASHEEPPISLRQVAAAAQVVTGAAGPSGSLTERAGAPRGRRPSGTPAPGGAGSGGVGWTAARTCQLNLCGLTGALLGIGRGGRDGGGPTPIRPEVCGRPAKTRGGRAQNLGVLRSAQLGQKLVKGLAHLWFERGQSAVPELGPVTLLDESGQPGVD